MIELFEILQHRIKENLPTILVTVIEAKGSTPGKPGFKMLIGNEGRIFGTVGGGGAEFYAINKAKELLSGNVQTLIESILMSNGQDGTEQITTKKKDTITMDALCGGEMTLFYERFGSLKNIFIFGAGHVGRAIAKFASELNFFITFIDNREEILATIPDGLMHKKMFFDFKQLKNSDKGSFSITQDSFIILVTHFHQHDYDLLKFIYKNYPNVRYVGMIGSVKKVKECINKLRNELGNSIDLSNFYSPIGLDIGGNTPNEIALGIMAEIQAILNGKKANHLRDTL